MNFLLTLLATLSVLSSGAAVEGIVVHSRSDNGIVKPMNAVNNGPTSDTFDNYKALEIPFARTHDTALGESYGRYCVDIDLVFPDWERNPSDPKAYDFAVTDKVIADIVSAGTEPFYRLGQSIEHQVKKYGTWPPKDNKKWARICEGIIRHYNEGWADGFHYGIRYWEIWNEPDLEGEDVRTVAPKTWGGTDGQFYDLFETAAKYLKKTFPDLKIGGPASCGNWKWAKAFLDEMASRKVPMDFFSWHIYHYRPEKVRENALEFRKMLDDAGYAGTESILDEWNFVRNWDTKFNYSIQSLKTVKGASFVAACMSLLQDMPVDMAMYYDFRPSTCWCGAFSREVQDVLPPYYAFYAWNKLVERGRALKVSLGDELKDDIFCTAAKGADGGMAILVVRYNSDNNELVTKDYTLQVPGIDLSGKKKVLGHLTDSSHLYTEVPLAVSDDGTIKLKMEPHSFILIEL